MRYLEIANCWDEISSEVSHDVIQKLHYLFASNDSAQVQSSFDLLCSYGEEALCEILEEKAGAIVLRNNIIHHHFLWSLCVITEVKNKNNNSNFSGSL